MAFDYRQFLAENKLTKVSKGRETGKAQILSEGIRIAEGFDTPDMAEEMDEANKQKEDYLKRQERARKGNWKGSIGAFVEEHGEELGNMISKNREQLKDYVENVMKPELNSEAKAKVDELLDSKKSTFGFIQSLYNFTLKGSGTGLYEEVENMEAYDDTMEESGESISREDVEEFREFQTENGWDSETIETAIRILKQYPDFFRRELEEPTIDDLETFIEMPEMYLSGDSEDMEDIVRYNLSKRTLYEAYEQKYKGTPQEKGTRTGAKGYRGKKHGDVDQDKMSKATMKLTGEDKINVTIGGTTKSVSTRAWKKYRRMTDPEEKKAWREKYGFVK